MTRKFQKELCWFIYAPLREGSNWNLFKKVQKWTFKVPPQLQSPGTSKGSFLNLFFLECTVYQLTYEVDGPPFAVMRPYDLWQQMLLTQLLPGTLVVIAVAAAALKS